MAKISFDLVSPESLIFSDQVGMVIIPGKDGDIGVLPGHTKLLSSLRPGRVMVYGEEKKLLKSYFVAGGFVEINPEKCILLAENVDDLNNLDKEAIDSEIRKLQLDESEEAKKYIIIAQAKFDALNASYYEKI
ncbi:MAG: ATP synthase epsilon chain [Alphaproteobacteria bacterium MarineAlpha5_Bin11]|nr:ATP synthase F1 subunit epsilon [Pelagibacteraceae bacterium]PPR45011.1 MAG: ATP synthase epsilon chain [Alphaproteobacteria bacterium MarineAlpha5_Bin11]PPR51417.1 MAG: ATP synthase epsilon chain [Alphaproteobacteria bacterium MarineAlpha5_Bin10]|tara:strand:+ start:25379 stop:25777 length:399 start_codon:yes stop_codon:yes gene_type:complete